MSKQTVFEELIEKWRGRDAEVTWYVGEADILRGCADELEAALTAYESPLEHIHPNELPDVPEEHRAWVAVGYNKAVDRLGKMTDGELMYQAGRILGGGERND